MEQKPIRAFLPVKLTEQERLEVGVKAAELQQELDQLKSDAKLSAKEWKTKIDLLDETFRAHLAGVHTGIMTRETDAIEVKDEEQKLQWIEKSGQKYNVTALQTFEQEMW